MWRHDPKKTFKLRYLKALKRFKKVLYYKAIKLC
jgi:hypothetical protein